ncbi:sulfotransferase family 2 domain-containing protein [Primorskyibacter sp. S87]|uniref:sulfotransferase family 2 domain-containing protein n=1 Tax=Primorskyibacter sp. S87 TaxID=3415126 RepID=UPI003C79763D
MTGPFDYFVVFAEMRTGSNFLETNLNAISGITCHGEAFNPHFIGYPNKTEILGVSQEVRDSDPVRFLETIKAAPDEINGFRYFHDHDPRILENMVEDPRCAKIILTRNPLDSYVSWKIAQATGQWKLTNVTRRREARVAFDAEEFARHVEALQDFQVYLLNQMQTGGQTAFYLAYEDLQQVDIMNGLAKWLGVEGRLEELDQSLKRQNPSPVTAKVSNVGAMIEALGGMDRFNLTRTPNFEPRRGPAVPSYVAGARAPILFQPIKGGPDEMVVRWIEALDSVSPGGLPTKMNQKQLRQWKRANKGHRSFTVLRHPLARAHSLFCSRILSTGPGHYPQIRETLRKRFKLEIPKDGPNANYTIDQHKAAFLAFLEFVRTNLAGQTGIRQDAGWCSQAQAISGFGDFSSPDLILREDEIQEELPALARRLGYAEPPEPGPVEPDIPYSLADIYDDQIEDVAADIYQRDYLLFGFGPWREKD